LSKTSWLLAATAISEPRPNLVDAPWDAYIAAPGDAPTLRETFARRDDVAEMIHVFAITWIG
jgi:hypothetical protein